MKPRLYYRLANIKSVYLSHEYKNEALKEYVRDCYFAHLFNMYQFEEILVDDMHVIINENDFKKISSPIEPYIKKRNDTGRIKPVTLSEDAFELHSPSNSYIIGRFTRNFVANNSKKGLQSIKNNAFKYERHYRNLKRINNAKTIVSLDFEYNGLSFDCVSEVGVSLYYPDTKETISLYYIIEDFQNTNKKKEGLRNSFHFGETRIVSKEEAYQEVMLYIKDAGFLVAHDIVNEMQILKLKPNWDQIIDTKYCELTMEPQEKYLSLTESLRKRSISCSHLHNAGNDAAYALKLVLHMYDEVMQKEHKGVA